MIQGALPAVPNLKAPGNFPAGSGECPFYRPASSQAGVNRRHSEVQFARPLGEGLSPVFRARPFRHPCGCGR